MRVNQKIFLLAVSMVIGGNVTLASAKSECERIADRLCVCEDEQLRERLELMRQCVELCEVQEQAIIDFETF